MARVGEHRQRYDRRRDLVVDVELGPLVPVSATEAEVQVQATNPRLVRRRARRRAV